MALDLSHIRTLLRGEPSSFGVTLAIFEGVADDALDAFARVDVFLGGDLVGRSLLEDAAGIGVNAFGVFAKHDEVDVFGLDSFQWTERGIEQAHGAHVGVEIHLEAHAQQDFFGVNVGLHARIAECADQDRVEIAAEHGEAVGRNGGLVAQIAVGAPVEIGELHGRARGLNHVYRLRNHFLADAVARDDGDALPGLAFSSPRQER